VVHTVISTTARVSEVEQQGVWLDPATLVRGTGTAVVLSAGSTCTYIDSPKALNLALFGSTLPPCLTSLSTIGFSNLAGFKVWLTGGDQLRCAVNHGGKLSPQLGRMARVSETSEDVLITWLTRKQPS
jgi:hypothetical protein